MRVLARLWVVVALTLVVLAAPGCGAKNTVEGHVQDTVMQNPREAVFATGGVGVSIMTTVLTEERSPCGLFAGGSLPYNGVLLFLQLYSVTGGYVGTYDVLPYDGETPPTTDKQRYAFVRFLRQHNDYPRVTQWATGGTVTVESLSTAEGAKEAVGSFAAITFPTSSTTTEGATEADVLNGTFYSTFCAEALMTQLPKASDDED